MRMLSPVIGLIILMLTAACPAADGYLFVTFKGEQSPMTEQIYFALSKDGRQWTALNDGQPVLVSKIGEKGVRDPYLIRSEDGKKFFLIATDLSINLNNNWRRAGQQGSKSIVIWESADLVNWAEPRLAKIAADDAGCTWAPEAVFDQETKDYLVFWAATNSRDNFAKHRIWASRTKDFVTFSEPFIYIEHPNAVIDTDIVREGDTYYRFSKDEKLSAITMEKSAKLLGPWEEVPGFSLAKMRGYEGPECYVLEPAKDGKPATWCLLLDHYARGQGYKPYITTDLSKGEFTPAPEFKFPFKFRHGMVMPISTEEYERLEKQYTKSETPKPAAK